MPVLINVLHQSKEEERKALVENLASLVSLLRQHLRKWLPELLQLIHIFWNADSQLQAWLLKLVSELAGAFSIAHSRLSKMIHPGRTASCQCKLFSLHQRPNEALHRLSMQVSLL